MHPADHNNGIKKTSIPTQPSMAMATVATMTVVAEPEVAMAMARTVVIMTAIMLTKMNVIIPQVILAHNLAA